MESWVNFGGKEGCTNIRISAKRGIEPGILWSQSKDLTNCANHARPCKVLHVLQLIAGSCWGWTWLNKNNTKNQSQVFSSVQLIEDRRPELDFCWLLLTFQQLGPDYLYIHHILMRNKISYLGRHFSQHKQLLDSNKQPAVNQIKCLILVA